MIIQAQAFYTNQINDFVEFKQQFTAKQAVDSDKNSNYKSETSLTTKLIDSLQFKFAFRVDYNTEVAADFENTNTETSVTLAYTF
jgi:putative salt-induced outer membrane protein YdiY